MRKLIFEYTDELNNEHTDLKVIEEYFNKDNLRIQKINFKNISERTFTKHYTELSRLNYCVDTNFYPLGSCTMKYNPKINEKIASMEEFSSLHPLMDDTDLQPIYEIYYLMDKYLCGLTGMDHFTLQPAAGAQGEFTGMMIFAKYFKDINSNRKIILIPDSAHGTNPASAALAGFDLRTIKSDDRGNVDLDDLKSNLSDNTAGLMITNPNTLGIFDENILEITELVHKAGGLCYYDGANFNAIMGYAKPADMGFDVAHLNLHKTFSTPHGGGGPGSGPVGVKDFLKDYLPGIKIIKTEDGYKKIIPDKSIGNVTSFYGGVSVIIKAFCYITMKGSSGLKEVSERAVLNANYLMKKLQKYLPASYERNTMHEFVLSGEKLKEKGLKTLDIAKRILDYGYYAPTIYFPHIVHEAMMFEPTETESKEVLDKFTEDFEKIMNEDPEIIKTAPHNTPCKKVDEVLAARKPVLRWIKDED